MDMLRIRERLLKKKRKIVQATPHCIDKRWQTPICCGKMTKEGGKGRFTNWKKRHFVLTVNGKMFYFKSETEANPIKTPVIVKGSRYQPTSERKKQFCIKIENNKRKPFFFFADDEESYNEWLGKLFEAGGRYQGPIFGKSLKEVEVRQHEFPYTLVYLFDVIRDKITNSEDPSQVFSKSGDVDNIYNIKVMMNNCAADMSYYHEQELFDLCGVVKEFFTLKSLPESIFGHFYEDLVIANNKFSGKGLRRKIRELLYANVENSYPLVFGLCREFFSFLHFVSVEQQKRTRVSVNKVSKMFEDSFFLPSQATEVPKKEIANDLMKLFIENYTLFFGEVGEQEYEEEGEEEDDDDEWVSMKDFRKLERICKNLVVENNHQKQEIQNLKSRMEKVEMKF